MVTCNTGSGTPASNPDNYIYNRSMGIGDSCNAMIISVYVTTL